MTTFRNSEAAERRAFATAAARPDPDMRFRDMPKANIQHTPPAADWPDECVISDPDIAAEVRQCARAVADLWTAIQVDAQAEREADQALGRRLREILRGEEARP
jgi:hypothetical protein